MIYYFQSMFNEYLLKFKSVKYIFLNRVMTLYFLCFSFVAMEQLLSF